MTVSVKIIANEQYKKKIAETTKNAAANKTLCYVSLSNPYAVTEKNLQDNKVDISKFIFIDVMTKPQDRGKEKNVIFVSSPKALSELNIAINKVLETGKVNDLLFDSLSALLIYQNQGVMERFLHSFIAKLRALNTNATFIILKTDATPDLLKNLYMFADEVVDTTKS